MNWQRLSVPAMVVLEPDNWASPRCSGDDDRTSILCVSQGDFGDLRVSCDAGCPEVAVRRRLASTRDADEGQTP
jgi:hypothetical protein